MCVILSALHTHKNYAQKFNDPLITHVSVVTEKLLFFKYPTHWFNGLDNNLQKFSLTYFARRLFKLLNLQIILYSIRTACRLDRSHRTNYARFYVSAIESTLSQPAHALALHKSIKGLKVKFKRCCSFLIWCDWDVINMIILRKSVSLLTHKFIEKCVNTQGLF